jgi:hypothetical protein
VTQTVEADFSKMIFKKKKRFHVAYLAIVAVIGIWHVNESSQFSLIDKNHEIKNTELGLNSISCQLLYEQ